MNTGNGQPREGKYHTRILVIDDDPKILRLCRSILDTTFSDVAVAGGGTEGLAHLAEGPADIVVTDLRMPDVDGFELIEDIRSRWPSTDIVAMTSFPSEEVVDRLFSLGVLSMLVKPFSPPQLSYTVMSASKTIAVRRENERLRMAMEKEPFGIVGNSPQIREVIWQIRQVGPLGVSALIEGESGTGKELVARGIHACSRRSKGAFVAVNCAAISPSLIESELFGHVKGAFTGATSDKVGLVETANKGTLFLDEIGEMPLELQPKLLRVLDSGETLRVGDAEPRYVDVRVVAASNRSLQDLVNSHQMRDDLYFRIRGFKITLPPLRQRGQDVLVLAQHFLTTYCPPGRNSLRLPDDVRHMLVSHSWPGNVRELQNLAAALYAVQSGDFVTTGDIAKVLDTGQSDTADGAMVAYKEFKAATLTKADTRYFTQLLTTFRGNIAQASKAAGMHPPNFRAKLRRYGIDPREYRPQT